jgi:hypothetical protein
LPRRAGRSFIRQHDEAYAAGRMLEAETLLHEARRAGKDVIELEELLAVA